MEKLSFEPKYALMPTPLDVDGRLVRRIIALKDFADVKTGDIGGYVSDMHNLSQEGECWIYGNGLVAEKARVMDDAAVTNDALVCGSAVVAGSAWVMDTAMISGNARVEGECEVCDSARICGGAVIRDFCCIGGDTIISGNSILEGCVTAVGDARLYGVRLGSQDMQTMVDGRYTVTCELDDNPEEFIERMRDADCEDVCLD